MGQFEKRDHKTLLSTMRLVIATHDKFTNGRMNKTDYAELRDGLGFNPNPLGLLSDMDIAAVVDMEDLLRTDWVHNFLQSGILTN